MKECLLCGRMTADASERCPEDGGTLLQLFPGPPVVDGKYLLERRLGRGGMGIVCLAEHLVLKRRCAIKLILPERVHDAKALARFRTEAEALGRLEHPGVVHVIDYGIDERSGGVPYLVMEHLAGTTLRECLRERGHLPLPEALPILDQAAQALDFAHGRGILHRDLKPENIFLVDQQERPSAVKLLDLGLARFVRGARDAVLADEGAPAAADPAAGSEEASRLTAVGSVVGTLSYMAPEAAAGAEPSTAADVYSFAVTVFETFTGEPPFAAGEVVSRAAGRGAAPRPPSAIVSSLPPQLDPILLAGLERDPRRRPRSATALIDGMRALEHRLRSAAWSRREAPRRSAICAVVAVLALVVGGVLARSTPLRSLENRLIDLRFALAEPRPPDPRILLVSIDEASLEADHTPLVDIGDQVGDRLGRALDLGASAVAIDVLLPRQWGAAPGFARFVMAHADALALAAESTPSDGVVGPEAAAGLITVGLGPRQTRDLFAFVNLPVEPDGMVRRFETLYITEAGDPWPTFAARAASLLLEAPVAAAAGHLIDYRVDSRRLDRLSWKDVELELEARPSRFQGRLILLGEEYAGTRDVHRVPHPASLPSRISGPALQALALHTLIDRPGLRSISRASIMGLSALIAVAVGGAVLWQRRAAPVVLLAACGAALWLAVAMASFRYWGRYLPVTEVAVVAGLAAGLALAARARLPGRPEPL